ncbi:hypothetical protein SEVIR_1G083351v4 [Setaria viridis]
MQEKFDTVGKPNHAIAAYATVRPSSTTRSARAPGHTSVSTGRQTSSPSKAWSPTAQVTSPATGISSSSLSALLKLRDGSSAFHAPGPALRRAAPGTRGGGGGLIGEGGGRGCSRVHLGCLWPDR